MIVVTGGAGFIGSNLVRALLRRPGVEVLVVDQDDVDRANLSDAGTHRFVGKEEFRAMVRGSAGPLDEVTAILHQGAFSRTDQPGGPDLIDNNVTFTLELLDHCQARFIPFIYASSAGVYGTNRETTEVPAHEAPLTPYADSKLQVDQAVRARMLHTSQVVGLRYFNVYGPRESLKADMASVVFQADRAVRAGEPIRLFGPSHGCAAGEQRRDFIHVDDVVDVIGWFLEHPEISGIFNCGTGRAPTFLDLARAVIDAHGHGSIEFVEMPEGLVHRYQPWTQADLGRLRAAGCPTTFRDLRTGVAEYVEWVSGERS